MRRGQREPAAMMACRQGEGWTSIRWWWDGAAGHGAAAGCESQPRGSPDWAFAISASAACAALLASSLFLDSRSPHPSAAGGGAGTARGAEWGGGGPRGAEVAGGNSVSCASCAAAWPSPVGLAGCVFPRCPLPAFPPAPRSGAVSTCRLRAEDADCSHCPEKSTVRGQGGALRTPERGTEQRSGVAPGAGEGGADAAGGVPRKAVGGGGSWSCARLAGDWDAGCGATTPSHHALRCHAGVTGTDGDTERVLSSQDQNRPRCCRCFRHLQD